MHDLPNVPTETPEPTLELDPALPIHSHHAAWKRLNSSGTVSIKGTALAPGLPGPEHKPPT